MSKLKKEKKETNANSSSGRHKKKTSRTYGSSSKEHSSFIDRSINIIRNHVISIKQWVKVNPNKRICILIVGIMMVLILSNIFYNGLIKKNIQRTEMVVSLRSNRKLSVENSKSDDIYDEVKETLPPKKNRKNTFDVSASDLENDLKSVTGLKHKVEKSVQADKYNVKLRPIEVKNNRQLICPDKGGGSNNKVCSKAYAEYLFQIPKPGSYYVYVETVAPNIMDNSLWVGAPGLDQADYAKCPTIKAGPLMPHKHVKNKKWLCCPKYLAANAKKNQGKFYCDCCISTIGPTGQDIGCILDLEVSKTPQWNMLPRALNVKSITNPLAVRIYAREDGSAWTRILLSSNPSLSAKEIS